MSSIASNNIKKNEINKDKIAKKTQKKKEVIKRIIKIIFKKNTNSVTDFLKST